MTATTNLVWRALRASLKTIRLALPKLGVGWMFALLTIDFNRIAIHELGITAVLVTSMLALHYFLSPFQVISGRFTDQHPIGGYRRTPYLLVSAILGSLLFVALPSIAQSMGDGEALGFIAGVGLFLLYGILIAVIGDTHHALIAEVTEPEARGTVISVVWTITILSTIIAAGVMNSVRTEYSPEAMQSLYNLTPFIVIISAFLGVIGIEKRLTKDEVQALKTQNNPVIPSGNGIQAARAVLRENAQARGFFAFIFIAILAIFLQDNILEVFGAEVFDLNVSETTQFQPTWGGGVLIGMLFMGVACAVKPFRKRTIALIGSLGTALGMAILATCAALEFQAGVLPALFFMGLFTGFFNVGALSMMMDMTVEGATGLYMGMWGMAQALGNGVAAFGGGALHTAFIESGLLAPHIAYFGIFSLEALGMLTAAYLLWHISVTRFHDVQDEKLTRQDTLRAMEAGAIA